MEGGFLLRFVSSSLGTTVVYHLYGRILTKILKLSLIWNVWTKLWRISIIIWRESGTCGDFWSLEKLA